MENATLPRAKPAILHLHRDRHGTFYFRITVDGHTVKKSLRTKDEQLATMRAARLNWELRNMPAPSPTVDDILRAHHEGKTRKFDLELPNGTKLRNINTDEDNRRAMELIGKLPASAFAPAPSASALPLGRIGSGASEIIPQDRGPTVKWVAKQYLDELRAAGLEASKGILEKEATYSSFASQFSNPKMLMVTKEMATAFKMEALKTAQASRVNKKIGHMSVLYRWAIYHGQALADPFEGMRIGRKSQLAKKVVHYEPFSPQDLKAIFNPKTWEGYAIKEHFHWLPFLLLYTGARPEELASLAVADVRSERAGRDVIEYFDITKAKSEAGIRKIPLHKAIRASGLWATSRSVASRTPRVSSSRS